MSAGRQLRLLLWKDYLIRKRKVVTLAGIAWATLVMLCLYAVRINVDNQDFPTCQFPARALPSAGMLTFMQSFICSVNNDCSPMDRFQEIPTYENSKLTQLQRRFSPLLHNETVLEVAATVPNALKLLATLADVLDHPTMVEISKNGLKVGDLFNNPARVRRYVAAEMNVSDAVAAGVMNANLSLTGLFSGDLNRCKTESMSKLLKMENSEYLTVFVEKLCALTDKDLQTMAMDLLVEINFSKYIRMIGEMYQKISPYDGRIVQLADMATALVRMTRIESFLPPALTALFQGREVDFSYFDTSLLTRLMDQFEPTFGRTSAYKMLRDIADTFTMGLDYLDRFLRKSSDGIRETAGLIFSQIGKQVDTGAEAGEEKIKQIFNDAVDALENATKDDSMDIFKILAQVVNVINKFLPDQTKHEVIFYSTLLAKLIEGANRVVTINFNIQEMAYDVSLRNPKGVKVLLSLPVSVVRKGFEGLADAERVQIVTSKLNVRGQIFCDSNKLASFFRVSKNEANSLKSQLCTDAWKDYVADLINSFGIYDVKDIINNMASIVVQETFGKDTSNQMYTIEQDFEVLKNFTKTLMTMKNKEKTVVDWNKLFNVTDDSEFMNIFTGRRHLGKQILITVHGALAKEVVKQNAILDFKISPILMDFTTLVTAVKDQLAVTPASVTDALKAQYPAVVQSMLRTLLDEDKTYKALSTPSEEVVCKGTETAKLYLDLTSENNSSNEDLVKALCGATLAIEAGLKEDSKVAIAIASVKKSAHSPFSEVNWTALIDGLKQIYIKLDAEYPYLFEFTSYGMSHEQRETVKTLMDEAEEYWFSVRRLDRSLHLSIKLLFRLLDVVDREAFGMRGEGWLKIKHALRAAAPPLAIVDDFVKLLTGLARNKTYKSQLPALTAAALQALIPNVPRLIVDAVDIIVNGTSDLKPIMMLMNGQPAWPCSNESISSLLPLSEDSQTAVQAIENLMCLDSGIKEEWLEFIHDRNISLYNASTWNTTTFGPHVFLDFSHVFDALVEDTTLIKNLVLELSNNSETDSRLTIVGAWKHAASLFDGIDRNSTLREFFANIDTVLDSVTVDADSLSTSSLWEQYSACKSGDECERTWRAAWKATLQAISVVVRNAAGDLLTYFTEINEPGANLLQFVGFTRETGLYQLVDKLPEFVAALLNSFWDYGFMSQIRRAVLTEFWECEAVLAALAPALGSALDARAVGQVKPFICPSLLYWISLPRGDNTFLDIIAKPQYTFYTLPAQNLTSSYEDAFNKASQLSNLLANIRTKNETIITEEDTKLSSLQNKLQQTVDTVLNYRINATDPSYRLFNEVNKKQFISAIYLTRITTMVNKIAVAMENLNPLDINKDFTEDEVNKLKSELAIFNKIFKRRPHEAIALHFDVITKVLLTTDDNFDLIKALDNMCEDLKNVDTSKDILNEGTRTKSQICSKDYKVIYGAVQNVIDEDYDEAKKSLFNLMTALQDSEDDVGDVFTFFNDRKKLTNSLKSSIKYSYDLGLAIYLKYLHSNLQNYNIVLSFLSGEDWWTELRQVYNGPHASGFFDTVGMSFEIAEDILTKMDEIHVVRLVHVMNGNDTSALCAADVALGELVPDAAGALTRLQRQLCNANKTEVFNEIPPLVFASQGYDDDLQLSKEINYTALYFDMSSTESRLGAIRDGPSAPQRPSWMTEEKIGHLRTIALKLLSKETLTKIAFGVLTNVVDGSTLFLNNSQCVLCSQLTSWIKQINLQLYKKQEYDTLMCSVHRMNEDQVHSTLKNDFHWDMAYRELISFRNYTKYELNKSLNELLGQIKLHLLEDVTSDKSKLAECLTPGDQTDGLTHAALLLKVVFRTLKLFRSELPHLREVDGMAEVPLFKTLYSQIAPGLDAFLPLKDYLVNRSRVREELVDFVADGVVDAVLSGYVNLRVVDHIEDKKSVEKYIRSRPGGTQWNGWMCESYDCKKIVSIIDRNINKTLVTRDLGKEQEKEFWKFQYISIIMYHAERAVEWVSELVWLGGRLDVLHAPRGLAATLDLVMGLITEESVNIIFNSVRGLVSELEPVLGGSALQRDLLAVTDGLRAIDQYRNSLAMEDIRVPLGPLVVSAEALEVELSALGVNNTNFWSLAAPRLHAGHILLKPILSWKLGEHVSRLVCQPEAMAGLLAPAELGVVAREDVLGAVADQLCSPARPRPAELLPVLLRHFNYTYVLDKVTSFLLVKLYSSSNLTEEEGSGVMAGLPRMASVLPEVQGQVAEVADSFSQEPLFKSLANFSSVGGLLGSSEFLSSAGNMLCGSAFTTAVPRLFRSVLASRDLADQPDQAQLDVLPTDFCRSLYTDIINMEGGKIVWSFVKPLLMGRVLYTPQHPLVERIIQRANSSFAHMARLGALVHSFADASPALGSLGLHRAGLRVLTSPSLLSLAAGVLGGAALPDLQDLDLGDAFDDIGGLGDIGRLLTKVSNLLHCINLDRFHPAASEEALEHRAAELSMVNEFSAGLVFLNTEARDLQYKIRMDIDNAPTTARLKNYFWIPGPEANFLENMRYFRGFVQIQDIVNRAIISEAAAGARRRRAADEAPMPDWAVYTQQMPYPCYRKDFFQTSLYESQALIVAFFFSLLYSVAAAVRFIVADYESGNTMLLHVMGVPVSRQTLSWFLWAALEAAVTCACVTAVLCAGQVLPGSDPTLVFTLILIFNFSVLCFCYMISKVFKRASAAAVCAAVAYLLTFMPVVLILSLEAVISRAAKIIICLSMSSSLCYAFLHVTRREAAGAGAAWSHVWEAEDAQDVSIGLAALMMLVDSAIYVAIGWTIDRFFGLKSVQSNITYCSASEEKGGVSVVKVSKRFGARAALDNVSVDLPRASLTALLGHNGAGKTTLINILTGMVKPSSGHVVVRQAGGARPRLGVCPQRDVLFDHMTAREHVALYAQLKSGKTLDQVQDEVDRMLGVLSLGAVCDRPVTKLSGGTRRRLCVALAFVSDPHLVSLDEPTSGVDPTARRDIWAMIVKLKEDRTILMTTHHLDEAELLSDQVIILHKGQVHTIGSPIEIKRSLGNGYRLSVTFPAPGWDAGGGGEVGVEGVEGGEGVEERSKQVLRLVRETVKNASLVDVDGSNIELNLPFFDADGLNNDFLRVCTSLEDAQAALGFGSYAVDCSGLDQVFHSLCAQDEQLTYETPEEIPSKSTSTSSIRPDGAPLVDNCGPLTGSALQQFYALMLARYLHYRRNRWLLFLVVCLPALFVCVAMAFSTVRPPPDNERALPLRPALYPAATRFIIPQPSVYSDGVDPALARRVMNDLVSDTPYKNWTTKDTPTCTCSEARQVCDATVAADAARPGLMALPDVGTLNDWLVNTQKEYIEKRYGGYSASLSNNVTNLVAWYNNKGHHALPAFLNDLHAALLRTSTGDPQAAIRVHSHPMKISHEQISKDTVYQHVADAGISGLVVVSLALVSGAGSVHAVAARARQEKRLQLLSGVAPALYCAAALAADMIVIMLNMVITAILMEAFHFPVFVERNNLPAICLLILLYGFSCSCLVHVLEKLFMDPSVANMVLFCGNAFVGLGGITVLLILDLISESDRTDNARWVLHKIFLLAPQFALGDGLLEIAKNTIQAQVLSRFGMDTYKDPLGTDLLSSHYLYLVLVGIFLFLLNLAIEYQIFDFLLAKFGWESGAVRALAEKEVRREGGQWGGEGEEGVLRERRRVLAQALGRERPLRLHTIGNINAGFVETEEKTLTPRRLIPSVGDVAACAGLSKAFRSRGGARLALHDLTLGIPPGQCTALLGENGAGKSTTFSLLTGQVRPSAGALYLAGARRAGPGLCTGLISYCPQTDAVDPLLTVRETLSIYCRIRGIADRDEVIGRTLQTFELSRYADTLAGALSGGNRRKLCSALAFMSRSPLILLDEPTSGMDGASRACVRRAVRAGTERGRAVVVSTHVLREARDLAARVALLREARLTALEPMHQCLDRFGGGYVVECRVGRGRAGGVWSRVSSLAPHAQLRVLHERALHFLLPASATVNEKEVRTRASDVFRLMAQLQGACDVEDFTINQSSLEQMFLSFSERGLGDSRPQPEPSPARDHLTSVTSL